MSKDLARSIALEAEHLTELEQQRQAEDSTGTLCIITNWVTETDAEFSAQLNVHKDKAGVVRMSYQGDDFVFAHTTGVSQYIVDNFYAKRKMYASDMNDEDMYSFMEAPVEVCLKFNRKQSLPLLLESELPELPAKLDIILQMYASGKFRNF